ncbi:The GLUG motif protein [compost metagenome]
MGTNAASAGYVIDFASASGNVKGESRSEAGGLVGSNQGEIRNASASGMISGGTYATLGGLVGSNQGKISQSVASGKVNVLSNYYVQVAGGLVGINYGEMKGNSAFGEAAKLPAVGANYGTID